MRFQGTRIKDLPPLPQGFSYRLDLSRAATPRLLKKRPRHRWFWFPHSYSPELVEAILDAWSLPGNAAVLDPFVGAGTTLLVAKERGLSATGVDLSPLSVRVSRAKVTEYDRQRLAYLAEAIAATARGYLEGAVPFVPDPIPSERLRRAFTEREYAALDALRKAIEAHVTDAERDVFLLALLTTAKAHSRAVADGGWFRWVDRPETPPEALVQHFESCVREMLADVEPVPAAAGPSLAVYQGDARHLDALPGLYDALITSPPYPNRHDYSRVFHIELLLLGEDEASIKRLRHTSLRSHVEARAPETVSGNGYREPETLRRCLSDFPVKGNSRVFRMLRGYFEDLYHVLRSAWAVLVPGARLALVVGNVRHAGILIPVDEILAEVGVQAGYRWRETWVIRLRGNSAQQMGRFGRILSRESVVFLEKPGG